MDIGKVLYLQPFFDSICTALATLFWLGFALTIILLAICIGTSVAEGYKGEEGKKQRWKDIGIYFKNAKRIIVALGIIGTLWVPCSFMDNLWEGYKLQMIHTIAHSDQAEKTIENINALLESAAKRMLPSEKE